MFTRYRDAIHDMFHSRAVPDPAGVLCVGRGVGGRSANSRRGHSAIYDYHAYPILGASAFIGPLG